MYLASRIRQMWQCLVKSDAKSDDSSVLSGHACGFVTSATPIGTLLQTHRQSYADAGRVNIYHLTVNGVVEATSCALPCASMEAKLCLKGDKVTELENRVFNSLGSLPMLALEEALN